MARINHVASLFGGGPGAAPSKEQRPQQLPPGADHTSPRRPEAANAEKPVAGEHSKKPKATWAALLAQLTELADKANAGDRQALDGLRQLLDRNPDVCRHVGNLSQIAENSWIDLLVEGDLLGREATKRQLAALKKNLAGEHPTPLEELLVDNITVAYLAQRHAEIHEAGDVGGSLQQAAYRLKRSESAQRRYLAAIKTLSTLRAKVPAGLAPLKGLKLHDPSQKVG